MAVPLEYTFKVAFKLWLYFITALLLLYYFTCLIYWTAVGLPLIVIVLNKWLLPPVDPKVADQLLGEVLQLGSKKKDNFPTYAISHRTSALDAPENTLAGISQAKMDGAGAVEFDVRFTKDDVAILIHDEKVDRTTNGKGLVADMTFSEIRTLDASAKHIYHNKFKGEKIPSLDEAIQLCLDLDIRIFLEAKEIDDRAMQKILELFMKHPNFHEKCVVVSFYPHFLYQLRKRDLGIVTLLVWRPCLLSATAYQPLSQHLHSRYPDNIVKQTLATIGDEIIDWFFHHVTWRVSGVAGVLVHKTVVSESYLAHWSRLRTRVLVWILDEPYEKDYFSSVLGLNYLTDTVQQSPSQQRLKCLNHQ